jgi:hypothetical protein
MFLIPYTHLFPHPLLVLDRTNPSSTITEREPTHLIQTHLTNRQLVLIPRSIVIHTPQRRQDTPIQNLLTTQELYHLLMILNAFTKLTRIRKHQPRIRSELSHQTLLPSSLTQPHVNLIRLIIHPKLPSLIHPHR